MEAVGNMYTIIIGMGNDFQQKCKTKGIRYNCVVMICVVCIMVRILRMSMPLLSLCVIL